MRKRSVLSERKVSSQLKRTSSPWLLTYLMTSEAMSMIASMPLPCECWRRSEDVAMYRLTPCTPVSTAVLTSLMLQRVCVRILDLRLRRAIASQSRTACMLAAGLTSSM